MLGNDISEFYSPGQGVIFEGLLAVPPARRIFRNPNISDWRKELRKWKPNELPLKALIDTSDRLGISSEVYTFLDELAVEAIDDWLLRKGISVPIYHYQNVDELAYDLKFKRSIRTIYVPLQEQAFTIGLRSQVVDPKKAWTP